MQLSEVKNDIAKIIYNPAENHLLPADFLLLEDLNQKLIAQIINISTTEDANNNIASVRLSLSIDKEDNLSYYNGHIPSRTSKVLYINPDEIMELIKGNGDTIFFGSLSNHSESFVKPPISFIDDKVYIQSDRDDKTKTVVQNMVAELYHKKKKVVLLDFDGRYNAIYNVPRLKVSDSFKLPLNIEAFNTILEYDITDCPIEDKAVIQSIVLELREYLNTLENKFLPFTLFRNVVDNEFMANPISGLMLLRNKLWLYAQESIFAESKTQFDLINNILEKQDVLVIDASNLEEKWHKFAIQTLVGLIEKHCYLVISLNDVPMDKKAIISLYNTQNIIPIVSTSYDSSYRQLLKSVCKNQILFKPTYLINDEDAYNALLPKINTGEFILYGESTLYLPLILELQSFDSSTKEEIIQNEIKKDVDNFLSPTKKVIPTETVVNDEIAAHVNSVSDSASQQIDEISTIDDILDELPEIEQNIEQEKSENIQTLDDLDDILNDLNDEDLDFLEEQDVKKDSITIEDIRNQKKVEPVTENQYDIFVPMSVRESMARAAALKEAEERDATLKQTSNDPATVLDEIVNTDLEEVQVEELPELENIETQVDVLEELSDVTISGADDAIHLGETTQDVDIVNDIDDVINDITDDVVSGDDNEDLLITVPRSVADSSKRTEKQIDIEIETDDEVIPPPVKEDINVKSNSKLPVYGAENISDGTIPDLPFQIGDKVFHPKHGTGVIEGFANYSNKILFCQIDFENVGRRILDPRIAGIEKIS